MPPNGDHAADMSIARKTGRVGELKPKPNGMVLIPGGDFIMGSDRHYPEEARAHRARVDDFWIEKTPVTNRDFRRFVGRTGHVTFAEIAPDPKDYPGRAAVHATRRLARLREVVGAGRSHELVELVDLQLRRRLAAPLRTRKLNRGARRSSRRPYLLS